MQNTTKLIKNHSSVRNYLNKEVSRDILAEILTCAQAASTSSFMQAYSIISITDKEKRNELSKLCGNQEYIDQCPVFLIFCADLHKMEIACNMNNFLFDSGYTEAFIIATVDASLAGQNAMIAAEALDLGGVFIGGIRNNPEEVSKLLKLPNNVYAVFGMCLGYPAEVQDVKPRLPMETVCFENEYEADKKIDLIKQYDSKVSEYYSERTQGTRRDTWSLQMAIYTSKPLRPHMKGFLQNKGFLKK